MSYLSCHSRYPIPDDMALGHFLDGAVVGDAIIIIDILLELLPVEGQDGLLDASTYHASKDCVGVCPLK